MTKRILVVEDQADLRAILRDLLTGLSYFVSEAADGSEGVAKAKAEPPDLILMDIQLPVLDGYETTRQIKIDPKLKATPLIAVSSYSTGTGALAFARDQIAGNGRQADTASTTASPTCPAAATPEHSTTT